MTNNSIPSASTSACRNCHKPIFWQKSARTGKSYPTDSATDRRAFHVCGSVPTPDTPIRPSVESFEATLSERLEALEERVEQISRTLKAVESRQAITSQDVPF